MRSILRRFPRRTASTVARFYANGRRRATTIFGSALLMTACGRMPIFARAAFHAASVT